MITLNLLSPQKKEEAIREQFYLLIKNIIAVILIFISAASILLLITRTILEKNFKEVLGQTNLITQTNWGLNEKIENFNKSLKTADKIQNDFLAYSEILSKFTKIVPPNIKIYSLNFLASDTSKELKIKVSGQAKLREDFLKFKDDLESSLLFKKIEYPITNLLNKENVEFELNFNLMTDK